MNARNLAVLMGLSAMLLAGGAGTARAGYTLNTLASFNGLNGRSPSGGLILAGNTLYGTAYDGGGGLGCVFSLPTTGGTPTVLASFNRSNGASPGALILSGNTLYGTTSYGGAYGSGTVFSVPITGGTPTVLASFNGYNGQMPEALILSGSTLYGTTFLGGPSYSPGGNAGPGTVFSIPITGGTPTVLASFSGSNGIGPQGNLILSGSTLYGGTWAGGDNNRGTVFSLPITGGTPTVLASFNGSNGFGVTQLALSGDTLYGTSTAGGAYTYYVNYTSGCGTLFSVPITGGTPTLLASFNSSSGMGPQSLVLSGSTLYGTTLDGGAYGWQNYGLGDGTVFALQVPEPATLSLLALGGLAMLRRRK